MSTPDISFKPLWKLLIDRDISRHELQQKAGVSRSTMWKMGRNDYVSLDMITNTQDSGICMSLFPGNIKSFHAFD